MNQDIKHYDKIVDTNCTNYIIKLIKEKPKNWIKHFVSNNRFVNIDTNNFYAVNHYNSLYLQTFKEMNQVKSRIIGTKKQWLNKDLKVKDNATPIYLKRLLFDDDRIIGCKAYKSYFADDVENYDSLNINEDEIFKLNKYNECELFNKYISNCNVKINYHKDGIAFYRPSDHSINLPYKEQFTDDLLLQIQTEISDAMGFWLPFVQIKKLDVRMDDEYDIGKNRLLIEILFNITRDPHTLASVEIEIDGSTLGGGGF